MIVSLIAAGAFTPAEVDRAVARLADPDASVRLAAVEVLAQTAAFLARCTDRSLDLDQAAWRAWWQANRPAFQWPPVKSVDRDR